MMLTLLFLIAASAFAQDKPAPRHYSDADMPPGQPVKAGPTVSDASKAKFWRAVNDRTQAQAAFERANKAVQETQEAMQKECGGSLTMDATGEPACAPKPEAKTEKK